MAEAQTAAQSGRLGWEALRRLDGTRKGILLQFLFESHLIGTIELHHGGEIVHIPIIVDLMDADLSGAHLARVQFLGVSFSYANLSGADLSGSQLPYAVFLNANLSGANLRGADLAPANLGGTDLSNANLYNALVGQYQLEQVKSLKGTILPDGSTFPSKSWIIPGRDANCVFLVKGDCSVTGQ